MPYSLNVQTHTVIDRSDSTYGDKIISTVHGPMSYPLVSPTYWWWDYLQPNHEDVRHLRNAYFFPFHACTSPADLHVASPCLRGERNIGKYGVAVVRNMSPN